MTAAAQASRSDGVTTDLCIGHDSLRPFVQEIFAAAGSSAEEARIVSDHLLDANLKGHDSHGAIRAAKYVDWVCDGQLLPNQHAAVIKDSPALLVIEGGFGYGQVIAREAMELAAEHARHLGLCAVAIRNAGHLGRIGAWPEQLAAAGLASIHFVNTSGFGILVVPYGGSDRRLSANPIAAGAPRVGRGPLILDIATSTIAEGKIQVARNRGEKLKPGVVVDGDGRPTTDPAAFYAQPAGAILPFGGHKGSGLSFFCEILAGSLTGGRSSHPGNPTAARLVNNMLSLAFDPAAFPDNSFDEDVIRLAAWTKASPPAEPAGEVLLPGEIEERTAEERRRAGVPLDMETASQLAATAARLGIAVPPDLRS
jgi:hydroxycarboxylate dehydrogenase B